MRNQNFNYDSVRRKVVRQKPSSLHIQKSIGLPFGLPLLFKIEEEDYIYIVTVHSLHTNKKYNTHFYAATAEKFFLPEEQEDKYNPGFYTGRWRFSLIPEVIQSVEAGRWINHSTIEKYKSCFIDDVEYVKLHLTMNSEKVEVNDRYTTVH